jgi:hypothetical protein
MANSDWAAEAFGADDALTNEQLQEWIDNTFGDAEWRVRQENKRAAQSAIHFGGVKLPELELTASELWQEHGIEMADEEYEGYLPRSTVNNPFHLE